MRIRRRHPGFLVLLASPFILFASCQSVADVTISAINGISSSVTPLDEEVGGGTTPAAKTLPGTGTKGDTPVQPRTNDDGWDLAALDTARNATYLSEVEKDVILEVNMVRTDPARYAELYLAPMRSKFNGRLYEEPGEITMMTNEGVAAVDEAIRVLTAHRPRAALAPAEGLSRAAEDHVEDTGPAGVTGHTGADGSTMSARVDRYGEWDISLGENISYGYGSAREIVIQLVVDDGVPSRGHRENLMSESFLAIGVAVGAHARYGAMCVMDFAGQYATR